MGKGLMTAPEKRSVRDRLRICRYSIVHDRG